MDMASSRDFPDASRLPHPSKQKHVDLPALQNASKVIQEQFVKDSQIIPDLGETTTACKCIFNRRVLPHLSIVSRDTSIGILQHILRRHSGPLPETKIHTHSS